MKALEFTDVKKAYGDFWALKGLSFSVSPGEFVGLLGPNGAGKSTSLEIALGLKAQSEGQVSVFGQSPGDQSLRSRVTCIPQDLAYPSHLKVSEILKWMAQVYKTKLSEELLETFQIPKFYNHLSGILSGGQRRRLALALAFLSKPELVILDEPTTGLDVEGKSLMWDYLKNFQKQGGTLVITSHDLYELTQLAERLILIDQGKLFFEGPTPEIMNRCQFKKVSLKTSSPENISSLAGIEKQESTDQFTRMWTKDSDELIRQLVQKDIPFSHLTVESGDLTEIFQMIRGQL